MVQSITLTLYFTKVKGKVPRHDDIWGSGGITPPFLTSALEGGEWSASRPCQFTLGERAPGTHWEGDWMGPRTGLDAVEKRKTFCPCRGSNPGRPANSLSLYRLVYPGSILLSVLSKRNGRNINIATCLWLLD
jgi:hypothetical protein